MARRVPKLYFVAAIVWQLCSLTFAEDTRACYTPDGTIAENNFACSPDLDVCCGLNAVCLSNLLCYDPKQSFVQGFNRGTCTDPTWQSSSCPTFCDQCKSPTKEAWLMQLVNRNSGTEVISCGSNGWCCDGLYNKGCDCTTGNGTFKLAIGTTITTIGVTGTAALSTSLPVAQSTKLATASASSVVSSRTSAAGNTGVAAFSSSSIVLNQFPSSISTTTSSSLSTSMSAASNMSSAMQVGIGVGVGVTVGVALVGFVAYLLLRYRKKRANVIVTEQEIPDIKHELSDTRLNELDASVYGDRHRFQVAPQRFPVEMEGQNHF
jgi:hypothetical protein